jgi:diketogulonate reductase-like aldo/keto reductase
MIWIDGIFELVGGSGTRGVPPRVRSFLRTGELCEVCSGIQSDRPHAGVNFFDNAWEYYNGKTETILGRALRDGRRDKVFLMTKVCTHGRSGKLAMQMLEDSLRRYQTDHLDL